jgi:transcriptional regulator
MSQKANYKGKEYNSRSQCALVMLSDGLPQREVAHYLGISDQAVSAVKKRAAQNVSISLRKAQKKADESFRQASKLLAKANNLSMIHTKIVANANRKKRVRYNYSN